MAKRVEDQVKGNQKTVSKERNGMSLNRKLSVEIHQNVEKDL